MKVRVQPKPNRHGEPGVVSIEHHRIQDASGTRNYHIGGEPQDVPDNDGRWMLANNPLIVKVEAECVEELVEEATAEEPAVVDLGIRARGSGKRTPRRA